MKLMKAFVVLAALMVLAPSHARAVGASPIDALAIAVGGQIRWLDMGEGEENNRDLEAVGNAAFSLTPHVSVTGGVAFGFEGSYFREQIDARLTASDARDPRFNVWVGAGRYWSKDDSDGLDEWAGKAGIGYRLPTTAPLLVGLTAAYGFDTERRQVSVELVYRIRDVKEAP